jgi:hypothetical protein
MCPPESCCCCKLEVGVKVGAGLFIAYSLLALVLVFAYGDANVDAFCSFEELESTAECGESCAVHESGAWFTAHATFYKFSAETVPGFSEDHPEVPIVPLCSSMNQADTTLGTQKTYFVPAPDASSPDDAEGVTAERAGIICSTQRCTEAQVADGSCSSTLATIASAEENERARQACGDSSCWLGLQSARTSAWSDPSEWDDGTAFAYTNWWPVDQPPAREDPSYPQVYVFMNIPGAEPGEHCSALRFHEYFGVFALLVLAGLSTLALMGANALDGKQLDMAWQGYIGLWAVTFIQSAIQTSQTTDLSAFVPPAWVWGPWLVGQFLIGLPLGLWWVISQRSLANQCKDGSLSKDADSG